ncbi:MAG TPA: shikimate dehydrogenase [Flavisolibacter sp.]|nr:shikimate dehydrogenase [Flavisolibacter sp.]
MKVFGLIGKTLKHSFSKNYFSEKFSSEQLADCRYENFELQSIDELKEIIRQRPEIMGLNVTIPYKEEVVQLLDEKNEIVEKTGACNCIRVDSGRLFGFNTDVIGFKRSLEPALRPDHTCALILGSGGAAKAVEYALNELKIDHVIVSRNKKFDQFGYEDLGEDVIKGHKLIINTTPLGMFPNTNQDPPIPYEYITPDHILYDLIYNPPKTQFLQKGEKQGAHIINGHEMLIIQAEESWKIWTGQAQAH